MGSHWTDEQTAEARALRAVCARFRSLAFGLQRLVFGRRQQSRNMVRLTCQRDLRQQCGGGQGWKLGGPSHEICKSESDGGLKECKT